jgi:hypothetical protein
MVAYSFNKRFAEPIASGHPATGIVKRQTIRAPRKRHARPGELLQLYEGMRTKHCRRIIADQICTAVRPVHIWLAGRCAVYLRDPLEFLRDPAELDEFARADGFLHWPDLQAFWQAAHPEAAAPEMSFEGVLIRWEPRS